MTYGAGEWTRTTNLLIYRQVRPTPWDITARQVEEMGENTTRRSCVRPRANKYTLKMTVIKVARLTM